MNELQKQAVELVKQYGSINKAAKESGIARSTLQGRIKSANLSKKDEQIIAFKGFDKDMKCRDFQFEVGKTYNHLGEIVVCKSGFHSCENPIDVLNYYPIVDNDCNFSRFAKVVASGKVSRKDGDKDGDSKIASKSIYIEQEINFSDFVSHCIDYFTINYNSKEIASSGDYSKLASSGDYSKLASSGYNSQLVSSGYNSKLASSGNNSKLASSGYNSKLASSGDYSKLASSGEYSKLASSGDYSQLVSSGNNSQLASSGDYSQLVSSGYNSKLASSGYNSQLVSSGYNSKLASSGYNSKLASSGDYSKLASSGYNSQLASSGYNSKLASSGNNSKLASSGDYSQLVSSGDYSQLVSSGNSSIVVAASIGCRAKVGKNGCIVLSRWVESENRYRVSVAYEGEDGIKKDVFYRLDKNGNFVEVMNV